MDKFFRLDGKFYTVMGKAADMILLSVFWLIGCIPVVTFFTSTSSLYHTVVKCVRYERGNVFRDFMEAYEKNLRQGIKLTLFYGVIGILLAALDYWLFMKSTNRTGAAFVAAIALLLLNGVYLVNTLWLVPVFSRFADTFQNLLKLNYIICIRHFWKSVLLVLIAAVALIFALGYNELVFCLPAVAALVYSYLVEPVLLRYMPKQETDNGDWRYGFQ